MPVTHVTNGVHMPTWDSAEADRFWETACSKDRWHSTMQELELNIRRVGDEALWELRAAGRRALIEYVREHATRQAAERGESVPDTAGAAAMFDAATLTLGFARRFATYKRPNLLLHDADRLARILMNKHRPVQLVIAGKAHPADAAGQGLIAQWIAFISRPEVRGHAVFLSDYDMLMAERLVEGVDLWINTPRRPWEACGTSGMKVLVNGGLNLSELDGWWAEAYQPEVGWAIGDGQDRGDDPAWDAAEADALYMLLEGDVASAFYTRDDRGIPGGWVAKMRESMARLTPAFSANRAVREYVERCYMPAATAYLERMSDGARRGQEIVAWRRDLERNWSTASIHALDTRVEGDQHLFRVRVDLGSLNPDHVQVELYGDGQAGDGPVRHVMTRGEGTAGSTHDFIYTARLDASRPAGDFTARLVPSFAGASIPLEAPFILWAENIR